MLGFLTDVLFYQPLFNLLMLFYTIFGGNLGLAIIAIAALVKLITIPITRKQLKSAEKLKEFGQKQQKIKDLYGKNKDKMNEELAKLSAQYMPAQLAGCLPLIILIVLLFQMRGVVIDLVNKGYQSYNEVAYIQQLQKQASYVKYTPKEDLSTGLHTIEIQVKASNNSELTKKYQVYIETDIDKKLEELKSEVQKKSDEERQKETELLAEKSEEIRKSNISIYSDKLDGHDPEFFQSVVLDRFLIFPTDRMDVHITNQTKPEFLFDLRGPSKTTFEDIKISIDGQDVTAEADMQKGESINLNFLGLDLSRVGREFSSDPTAFAPYIILTILLGITQFWVTQSQQKLSEAQAPKKPKKQNTDQEPDFAEIMQQSNKQMIYFMPIFTMLLSLGYVGGSSNGIYLFPAAVSLFWTAQNTFVIIQMFFTQKLEIPFVGSSTVAEKPEAKADTTDTDENKIEEAVILSEPKKQKKKKKKKK